MLNATINNFYWILFTLASARASVTTICVDSAQYMNVTLFIEKTTNYTMCIYMKSVSNWYLFLEWTIVTQANVWLHRYFLFKCHWSMIRTRRNKEPEYIIAIYIKNSLFGWIKWRKSIIEKRQSEKIASNNNGMRDKAVRGDVRRTNQFMSYSWFSVLFHCVH